MCVQTNVVRIYEVESQIRQFNGTVLKTVVN